MASTLHTKIVDLYLKGFSNIQIMDKLQCDKAAINKVFSRMTEDHHNNLKLKAQNDLSQIGIIEARLFDRIHKMSETEYNEASGIYSKFLVK